MALFKVFRGNSSNLPAALHDGYAYLTTDDGKFYIDTSNKRITINPDLTAADISYNNTTVAAVLSTMISSAGVDIEINTTSYWTQHIDIVSK